MLMSAAKNSSPGSSKAGSKISSIESLQQRPDALIFDMDGTLLDTEPLYTKASQKVMDPYGAEFTPELKRKCMGGDSRISAQLAIDHGNLPMSVDDYLEKREVFLRELFNDVPEITGAGEFITALSQTDLAFGLATSSHQHLCKLKLGDKQWGQYFHQVVCGDHPKLKHGKPDPDIFLLCAEMLSVEPEKCIAFEDSPNGIAAARAAGMLVIAINSPYVTREDLGGAALIIDNYQELQPMLAGWSS